MKKVLSLLLFLLFVLTRLSAQETKIKVACIGNSITFGAGIKDRANHSYPSILGRMLGKDYEVQNFGVSARTLLNKGDHPYMKEVQFQDALNYQPDIVVIKLGTNDTKPQNWKYKNEYQSDMEQMVNAFHSLPSHPRVYLCYPATAYSIKWGINDSIIVHDVIPMIDAVARKLSLEVIDLHSPTANKKELFPDDIHPNPEGAAILANEVYKTITKKKSGSRILFIGDSITDGNWGGGGAKPSSERNHWDQNHIFGSGYMYLCAAHYQGLYPEREYRFLNRGISGHKLEDLKGRWEVDVLKESPDVLSVLIGTNDIDQFMRSKEKAFDFERWGNNYKALIDASLKQNPHLKLVLCSPFVVNSGGMKSKADFALRDSLIREAGQVVEKIAADCGAVFINYQQLFDELYYKYPALPDTYWLWDGIHPTPAGHQKMAERWVEQAGDF